MDDDLQTIRRIREGDESALIDLMDRYREPIFRLAYRYAGNAVDAANLAEETFTKVFFNARKFSERASVKTWVFAIASNLFRDFLRRERRARETVSLSTAIDDQSDTMTLAETIESDAVNAAEALDQNERIAEIQAAIHDLPEKLRFPFIFCVLEGHSHDDAAEVLKTTRKTVESRIYRARHELQNRLKD
jgi:RNA polymerase sigma-70 factor (ECF subfamily)